MIAAEITLGKCAVQKDLYRFNDLLASISTGTCQQLVVALLSKFADPKATYRMVNENFGLINFDVKGQRYFTAPACLEMVVHMRDKPSLEQASRFSPGSAFFWAWIWLTTGPTEAYTCCMPDGLLNLFTKPGEGWPFGARQRTYHSTEASHSVHHSGEDAGQSLFNLAYSSLSCLCLKTQLGGTPGKNLRSESWQAYQVVQISGKRGLQLGDSTSARSPGRR